MKYLLILLIFTISLFAEVKKLEFISTYGITTEGNLFSKFKDAKIVLKSWLNDMGKIHGGQLDIKYYPNGELLFEAFKEDKFDMIAIDLPFFFKNRTEIEDVSNDTWTLSINEKKFNQYYLIGNKSNKLGGFSDLKAKSISLKEGDTSSWIWLDKNSYKTNMKASDKLLKKIQYEKKEKSVILNVFFKKSNYGIVTKEVWDLMLDFNPGIKSKVEILSKSKNIFLPFIGFFSEKSSLKSREAFFMVSKDLNKVKGGEQIIEIMKFNSIYKLDNASLVELDNYYNEYFKLKKKYR